MTKLRTVINQKLSFLQSYNFLSNYFDELWVVKFDSSNLVNNRLNN